MFYFIDIFALLDQVTQTEGVSLVQINNWLLSILGIFVTVIIALFVYMNSRFTEASTDRKTGFSEANIDRNSIKKVQNDHSIALARIETLLKLSITLKGYSLDQIDNMVENEIKSSQSEAKTSDCD